MKDRTNLTLSRRSLLKGMAAAGAASILPCRLLTPKEAIAAGFDPNEYQTFRNACPRNCYDTCSIKTYVQDGVIKYIEGAPESTYTKGGLCVKGYSYPRRVYSPDRIKYPMIQDGRRSGKWRRISWDDALDRIAKKILELKETDGNLLGMGLTKYSGNFSITSYGVEGMMSSLGYTTRFVGTPCWPAGIDAQNYDLGDMWCNDPEDMVKSKYIILWGVNPAWCAVHSMKYIQEAKRQGAKVLVIDPIFTQTAAKGDVFWQPKPAGDGALALGMAKHILDKGLVDNDFVNSHAVGFNEFADYLNNNITVEWAAEESGIPAQEIRQIAEEFATADPATIWIGYGMQRHTNGGASVRSIDALVAMTGNVGKEGGGARYGHLQTWGFNYHAMIQSPPEGSVGFSGAAARGEFDFTEGDKSSYSDRTVNINKTAQEILDIKDPSLKLFWVACKNPFAQDFDRPKMERAFDTIDLVVSAEQFFTETVANSDIVLPVTTLFEEWTVNVSYWHYWMGINEQAIKPLHEAKSNLEIAAALSKKLNSLSPGSCTFQEELTTEDWTAKEFNQGIYDYFGIKDWKDLKNGPVKAKLKSSASWSDKKFGTPSGKYEFKSEICAEHGHKALPEFKEGRKAYDKFQLLTPHTQFALHSQFANLDWMKEFNKEPFVYMHPAAAAAKGIKDLDMVRVFNKVGEQKVKVKLTDNVSKDCLIMYEAWYGKNTDFNVQNLVDDESADMGAYKAGAPGAAIHGQFADIEKA
ncbi:molybdopterin-dependent oxidoreductase [Desulfosediminicola ganghwensis]|uniref:molybdopterin-dependent oxidoreductase n=1 Tax=Desulfosediminicola ganghwensis TaxID=2569540 RepID=UPI0010AC7D1E|nr:molybdopterin-dependent oxidoreductase [Desulfosediminicola ganghwensis]